MSQSRVNAEREQRLAEALRANLLRRKDQARARRTSGRPGEPDPDRYAPVRPDGTAPEASVPDGSASGGVGTVRPA